MTAPDTSLPALVAWHRGHATAYRQRAKEVRERWARWAGRVRLAEDADKDAERAEATAAALERLMRLEEGE